MTMKTDCVVDRGARFRLRRTAQAQQNRRRRRGQHPGHLRRRRRCHNISAYSDGLMGYETPNIDRIAKEASASCITTPTELHRRSRGVPHRAARLRTGLTKWAPGRAMA